MWALVCVCSFDSLRDGDWSLFVCDEEGGRSGGWWIRACRRRRASLKSARRRQSSATNTHSLSRSLGGESTPQNKTEHTMPPKKQHALASRVKRIMQADEDVGKIAQATPILIGEKRGKESGGRGRERRGRSETGERGAMARPSSRPRKRARAPSLPTPCSPDHPQPQIKQPTSNNDSARHGAVPAAAVRKLGAPRARARR